MSLTAEDLQNIREVVREEITAIESDIKELYKITTNTNRKITKMKRDTEHGFKNLRSDLAIVAQQTGVNLTAK